ncbi:hypothetical protein L9F63_018764, partial [Diploptera punctata]
CCIERCRHLADMILKHFTPTHFGANSSYVFGNDTLGGWGPRYFFTFYSQFGSGRTIPAGIEHHRCCSAQVPYGKEMSSVISLENDSFAIET